MASRDNIVLTGMMGSGKTTIGSALGEHFPEYKYIDTDKKIEKENGLKIPDIFAKYGEPHFRRLENQQIRLLMNEKNQIISIGGGAFENEDNRKRLLEKSTVIYLKTDTEEIIERIQNETHRPLLSGNLLREKVLQISAQRAKNYELAHITIDTTGKTPYSIVEEILGVLDD